MSEGMVIAQAVAAHTELEKAKSLRSRMDSHGQRMSCDAKEILWAMIFAHEDAAKALLHAARNA